jgi:hypothetical protein
MNLEFFSFSFSFFVAIEILIKIPLILQIRFLGALSFPFFFWSYWSLNSGLHALKQVRYHLSHASSQNYQISNYKIIVKN